MEINHQKSKSQRKDKCNKEVFEIADHKLEISKTNRGKNQIILDKKYKYNFLYKKKDNTKIYRCTEYKTIKKCPSTLLLNENNELIELKGEHNHNEMLKEVSMSLIKNKIEKEIINSSNPFEIKPKNIFNEKAKEVGFICPEYNSIQSQITRKINKILPKDIETFEDIPDESEYYKTEKNEIFMIYKDSDIIIFQSPFQAAIFKNYNDDVFGDGTFYIAPKISYQVFITRNYVKEINSYYTTSFSILKNKNQKTYETLFKQLKINLTKFNNNLPLSPKNFHCDFEKAISNAVLKIFPASNIKFCIWHYKRALEIQKNKICYNEVDTNNRVFILYRSITNFPFINPEYIYDIYNKFKEESETNNYKHFLEFLDYFKKTYLITYEIKYWNYYDHIEHITNNACESFNNYLNNIFSKKPTFFKLLFTLKKEEGLSNIDYERRTGGIWQKRKIIYGRTDEIDILIQYFKDTETESIEQGFNRNAIIDLWIKCLIKLNNRNILL